LNDTPYLIQHILDSCSIIRVTVARCTLALHADNLANGVVYVLGMGFPKYSTRSIQQRGRLVRNYNVTLRKSCCAACPRENISLSPGRNCRSAAGQDSGSPVDTNCDGDIVQLDVIQDQRAAKFPVACGRRTNKNGSIGDDSIDDGF